MLGLNEASGASVFLGSGMRISLQQWAQLDSGRSESRIERSWLPCMSGDESPQRHRLTRQRGASLGRPTLGASASRASMEALDIMCLVPSFHESSSPAFSSCDTRAELTPSIRAASNAVTAGMSPSSRLTATAIILPPCRGSCPKSGTGSSMPSESKNSNSHT